MTAITACRSCGSKNLAEGLSLGNQRLSWFPEDPSVVPPSFPLELVMCEVCVLGQLRHTAPPEDLYTETYSFKSGVSDAISRDLRSVVEYALAAQPDARNWLDIASNDGTLLSHVPESVHRVGIDPLKQFADEARTHADEIVTDFFSSEALGGTTFDVITSVSMFYDVDNPNEFVAGVKDVLAPNGVWVIQQNYLLTMLSKGSFDNISHEHLTYYSLASLMGLLGRHGLEVVDVELNPINGGCFRTLVARSKERKQQETVGARWTDEIERGFVASGRKTRERLETFARQAREAADSVGSLVRAINRGNETVYVYGASTRGGVIWQAAGLDVKDLPVVVDRNPDKVGRYMASIGAPIISESEMRERSPDFLLVGPYWFRDEFVQRERGYLAAGGRFIFPLPTLSVVPD